MTNSYLLHIRCQKPIKTFEGYDGNIFCIATFPDDKRIATISADKIIRIRRLEDSAKMMKWVVNALVLLNNGK